MEDEDLRDGQDRAEDESYGLEPVAAPGRVSSSGVTSETPAPRMARFGEGPEGRAARRERGVAGPREGFFGQVATFWRDVRTELRRVTWPTLKEVQNTTIVTVVAVAFFAAYLWVVDQAFAKMLTGLAKLFGG